MADYQDIRSLVLGGGVPARKQAIYVERLGGWLNVHELYGDERARVLQDAMVQKTGTINLGALYAGLVVQALHYPHPAAAPQAPVAPVKPDGTLAPEVEAAYAKAIADYQQALADYQHPYPTDHPHAGEKVFQPADRDQLNQMLPGDIIEQIAQPAFALSGLKKEDVESKKDFFSPTTAAIASTTTTSPSASDAPTPTAS